MNRSLYLSILLGFGLLLATACKKQTLLTYNAADNIYFNFIAGTEPTIFSDSVNITFAFSDVSVKDTLVNIPVAVTGVASDHDRTFSLTIDPSSTAVASTDYVMPSSLVIHAGRIVDTISIRFKRTATLQTTALSLALRLAANDQFKTQLQYRSRYQSDFNEIQPGDTMSMQTFKVNLSDMLQAGPYWDEYSYFFGDFSEKKVRLMNQIAGMPLDFWSVDLYSTNAQQASALHYGGFTFRYLSDQAYNGNTIYEADGITPMTMGYEFQ